MARSSIPVSSGDRVEDRVALLLGAAVGHGEHRVGPVGIRGALVAVRDAPEGGHPHAQFEDLLVRDLPDAHAVGAESRPAVEQDRRHPAQKPALLHAPQVLEQALLGQAEFLRRGGVGLRDDRHVALGGPDHGTVEFVVGLSLGFGGLGGLGRGGQGLRAGLHLQVHADLEQLQRGQLTDRFGAGQLGQDLKRALQAQRRIGLRGDGEPDVELVVAQVIVRHPGVGVDHVGRPPRVLRIDLGRDQHRGVAQGAGVEDRSDLADDPLVEQALDPGQDLLLADPGLAGHGLVGAKGDRESGPASG